MAAKRRKLSLVLAAIALLAAPAAFASIPPNNLLTPPSIDLRYEIAAVDDSSIDNARLLHRALDHAMATSAPVGTLFETRVWVSRLSRPLFDQETAPLSRLLRQSSAVAWRGIPSGATVLSPDPLGYKDSSNLYAFAGGDPVNRKDPTGTNEVDVHHWLTVFLARGAGFDEATAREIGFQTQELDLDERDAMYGRVLPTNPANMVNYHMVSPSRLADMRESALAEAKAPRYFTANSWRTTGEYLHALEDSYAHQQSAIARDFNETYNQLIGHGARFHHPDWTWERINIGMDMAKQTFTELVELCRASGRMACADESTWSRVHSTVERFIAYKPELTGEVKFGKFVIANATSRGYNEKINILNTYLERQGSSRVPLFARPLRLTGREQAERDAAKNEYLRLLNSRSAPIVLDDPDQ